MEFGILPAGCDRLKVLIGEMKTLPFAPVKLLQNSKFYLFGLAVSLSVLHLSLIWRVFSDVDRVIVNALFWGAILCLLWRKQDNINLESGIFSSFFGLLLVALVLLKSISLFWFETYFLRIIPLIGILGLGLLASGIKGLKQYWRELIIVGILCLPEQALPEIIEEIFKVTTLTAKFAGFVLWYLGFEVSRQGANVILPKGAVLVFPICTGTSSAIILLKLSAVFMLMFPTGWSKKILLAVGAVLIAFVTGAIRVALMAVVVSNQELFHYWHGSQGNQIFSSIAILTFWVLCYFLRSPDKLARQQ